MAYLPASTTTDTTPTQSARLQQPSSNMPLGYLDLPAELQLITAEYAPLGGLFTPRCPRLLSMEPGPEIELPDTAMLCTCRQIYTGSP